MEAEAQQREQDALDAARSFDAEDFVGAAGRKHRWAAMQRVLLVSRSLLPKRVKGLARDWAKWDACNVAADRLYPSAQAYALQYRDWLVRLLRLIGEGEPQRVAKWWEREVSAKVPAPDVEVPPLPGDLLRGATHILGEGRVAP